MSIFKVPSSGSVVRGEPLRQQVLDAAERLLAGERSDFSMRDLANEAAVSFATPFNQFGNKAAIMEALSTRRIDTMEKRFRISQPLPNVADRVLMAVKIAVDVMLEAPTVNRTVMGWLGTARPSPGQTLDRSTELWVLAIGSDEGSPSPGDDAGRNLLSRQLAFAFRGVLSFWTAGELSDGDLAGGARAMASTLLSASRMRRDGRKRWVLKN